MPVSKQARSKQERQKDRLAREHAARQARQERRRRIAVIVVLALVVVVVLSTFAIASGGSKKSTTPTTAPAPTADKNTPTTQSPGTAALASAAGKPCVATKGPLPQGAPNVPVPVGPPPTSLVKQDLKVGTGAEATTGGNVTVNYIGVACSSGVIFDSSYKAGQPYKTSLENVIDGWKQGIPGMKVGGERLLGIPSELAYKSAGFAPNIAPDEALWFVVTLESVR